jgi:hypothetical protein
VNARRAGAPALLVAAVVLAWLPSLSASFQFDDWNVIVDEPRVASLAAWAASMPGIRPLLKLSYAANNELARHLGGGVAGFRAVNVAIHAANAVLVFGLLLRLARALAIDAADARCAAGLAAVIFALHPVQTEAVTYISGRSSALSALFALGAMHLGWRAALRGSGMQSDRPACGKPWPVAIAGARAAGWSISGLQAASLALLAAALAVKETAAATPLALWLLLRTAADAVAGTQGMLPTDQPGARSASRWAWWWVRPHAALVLVAAAAAAWWPPYRRLLDASLDARAIGANLLTQCHAIAWLAGQLLQPTALAADPALPVVRAPDPVTLLLGLAIVAAIAAGLFALRRSPAVGCGILWFFVWLLPTNSLLPRLDVANDRQLYLALVGPAWLLGLITVRGVRSPRARAVVLLALASLLAAFTLRHNRVYADEITYWHEAARQAPHNPRALGNLGYALARACRDEEAATALARAAALDPTAFRPAVNLRLLREGALPRTCSPPVPRRP